MMGTSSVQPSMCQSKVPFRYAAAGFLSGLSVTRKISGFSPRPSFSTVPSLRLNATWASSSRWRPRKTSAPLRLQGLERRAPAGRRRAGVGHGRRPPPVRPPSDVSFSVVITATRGPPSSPVSPFAVDTNTLLRCERHFRHDGPGPRGAFTSMNSAVRRWNRHVPSEWWRTSWYRPDELDRPAVLALQEEEHVAAGPGLVGVPVGDVGVDDDVALGSHGASTGRTPGGGRRGPRGSRGPGSHRRRPGRTWRRRRRSDRRPGPGRRRPGWPGCPLRRLRSSSSAPSPVSRVALRGRGRRPAARAG